MFQFPEDVLGIVLRAPTTVSGRRDISHLVAGAIYVGGQQGFWTGLRKFKQQFFQVYFIETRNLQAIKQQPYGNCTKEIGGEVIKLYFKLHTHYLLREKRRILSCCNNTGGQC